MGFIVKAESATKGARYSAKIRIRRQGLPEYKESKTFSTKAAASSWLKKREKELEDNPDLMHKKSKHDANMTLEEAIIQYMKEVTKFGRSKRSALNYLQQWPIAKKKILSLKRQDYSAHIMLRREGCAEIGANAVEASTAQIDLQYIRSVLNHAELVWNIDINLNELEKAGRGLRNARLISESNERDRLPSRHELQVITTFSYKRFNYRKGGTIPMFLIIWLVIYTGRRISEVTRLDLRDYDQENGYWKLRAIKHPNGSIGNDKWFVVNGNAKKVIDELLKPEIRNRMLRNGGDENLLVPLNHKSLGRDWQTHVKNNDIEDLHFHDLRHEAATRLAEQGFTIPQIQQYTLHEDWNSLKRYVNMTRTRKKVLDFDEAINEAINSKIIIVL